MNIKAVRDTKTGTAIKVFKEHFGHFGTPNRLITDRGTCFTSTKFKSFTLELGIKHILNAVATPRANGQVERFNRTVLNALGARCHGEKENTWDEYVDEIQLSINTTINKSTGRSPSELLFECKLVSPCENIISDVICSAIVSAVANYPTRDPKRAKGYKSNKQLRRKILIDIGNCRRPIRPEI